MNLLEEVLKIIKELDEAYEWGGSEDYDGNLQPGTPDFDEAKKKIIQLFESHAALDAERQEK